MPGPLYREEGVAGAPLQGGVGCPGPSAGRRGLPGPLCREEGVAGAPLQPTPTSPMRRSWSLSLAHPFLSPLPPQEYVAYSHTGRIIPAIWFRYDLSPITVKYTERRQPLYRFITTVSGQKPLPRSRTQPAGWGAQPVHTRVFRNVDRRTAISMAFHQESLFQRGMPLIRFHPLSSSLFSCSCSRFTPVFSLWWKLFLAELSLFCIRFTVKISLIFFQC